MGTRKNLLCLAAILLMGVASMGASQSPTPDKGELKIEGTHISRLVLERQDGHQEEWSNVGGSISLAVGTYRVRQITLAGDCSCQPQSLTRWAPITVALDKPAVLKAGGPLRQTVDVTRRGRVLVLNYGLAGIGDEKYVPQQVPNHGASFTIYKGDKKIASGQFEYG